jgi:hypothetical protein
MKKLSTGDDNTLDSYLKMCKLFFGDDSEATKFMVTKIEKSTEGGGAEVIQAESQMVHLLGQMHIKGLEETDDADYPVKGD